MNRDRLQTRAPIAGWAAAHAMRTLTTFFLLSLLTGCTTTTKFTESIKPRRSPHVVATEATQTTVTFRIVQDSGVWLARIRPRVIDGGVYLDTLYISSPVHQAEFTVDLSASHFPHDWRQRLYWIESESVSSPLVWWKRVREIERRKVQL
jgi:hypothetical protein